MLSSTPSKIDLLKFFDAFICNEICVLYHSGLLVLTP
jgi:hypothetical protein